MKRSLWMSAVAAVVLLAACGEETRNGQLSLAGSAPLRIADEGGQTVEFTGGPLKVQFGADRDRKFTVQLEQGQKKAKFSGQVPYTNDWNFTVRGRDIGQPADFTSKRTLTLNGPVYTRWGMGGFCGFNGQWETEEQWQRGDEDWSVAFNDANSGAAIGTFASKRTADYLINTRNIWCRERPMPHEPREPHIPHRVAEVSKSIGDLQETGVSFQ